MTRVRIKLAADLSAHPSLAQASWRSGDTERIPCHDRHVKTLVRIASTLAMAAGATLTVAPTAQAAPVVRFTKIYFDSPGSDTGSNYSLNAEWARVKNFSSKARILTGWTIRDPQGHVYKFPTFTLRAGYSVTLHTGNGTNTATNLYWHEDNYVWNNSGDKAILRNRVGTLIDTCSFTGAGSYKIC
jgi:hypothetical protein